jgi:LysR family hydrogen peroxide-inducible transcriptional activator
MVAANIGVTLMPELALGGRGGAVRYVPFRGRPPSRDIGLVWRATASRAELLSRMARAIQGPLR